MLFPSPPPDGGFLVLHPAQIGNLDLLCAIKTIYPRTKIIASQPLLPLYGKTESPRTHLESKHGRSA